MSKAAITRPFTWRKRTGQRGAVAVEACIVIVMMTGIVMGTWYTRMVFSAKLATINAGRADAWKDALKGCDSTASLGDVYKHLHEESKDTSQHVCQDPNDCSTGNGNVDGLSNDGSTKPDWFPASAGNSSNKSMSVAVDSLYTTTVSTTAAYACNPTPHNELDLGAGLADAIGQILKIPDEEVTASEVAKKCQKHWVIGGWKDVSCDDYPFKGPGCGDNTCDPLHWYSRKVDITLP